MLLPYESDGGWRDQWLISSLWESLISSLKVLFPNKYCKTRCVSHPNFHDLNRIAKLNTRIYEIWPLATCPPRLTTVTFLQCTLTCTKSDSDYMSIVASCKNPVTLACAPPGTKSWRPHCNNHYNHWMLITRCVEWTNWKMRQIKTQRIFCARKCEIKMKRK